MFLNLTVLPGELAVCRLPAGTALPVWVGPDDLTSVTWSADETSIVCAGSVVPDDIQAERGWRAIKVAGPLDFVLTGVLLSITRPLAEAGVPVFAVSTYDTDYILVKESALEAAMVALEKEGHTLE